MTGFIVCSGIADLPFGLCALFWLSRSASPVDSGSDRGFNLYSLLVPEHVGNTSKLRRRCPFFVGLQFAAHINVRLLVDDTAHLVLDPTQINLRVLAERDKYRLEPL